MSNLRMQRDGVEGFEKRGGESAATASGGGGGGYRGAGYGVVASPPGYNDSETGRTLVRPPEAAAAAEMGEGKRAGGAVEMGAWNGGVGRRVEMDASPGAMRMGMGKERGFVAELDGGSAGSGRR